MAWTNDCIERDYATSSATHLMADPFHACIGKPRHYWGYTQSVVHMQPHGVPFGIGLLGSTVCGKEVQDKRVRICKPPAQQETNLNIKVWNHQIGKCLGDLCEKLKVTRSPAWHLDESLA